MTLEDGTGLPDSDTYVDPAAVAAVAYMDAHLYAPEWVAATAPNKERAVIMATRVLDATFDWIGDAINTDQALGWPRRVSGTSIPDDAVPNRVWKATLEMALALLQGNRITDTAVQGVNKIALGDGALSLDLTPPATSPPSRMVPGYIIALLRDYGYQDAGGPMVRAERR